MILRCFGSFALEGAGFVRRKPLLLIAHVAIEGPQPRERLARLFWPTATDARNRLSVALSRIRRELGEVVVADDETVRALVPTDVPRLERALERSDWRGAIALHGDGFLSGEAFPAIGEELETWIVETRERLATDVRRVVLDAADVEVAAGRFEAAAARAEAALAVAGAPPLEPHDLPGVYALLAAGGSAEAASVRAQAEELGIGIADSRAHARAHLLARIPPTNLPREATSFVGRRRERTQLSRGIASGDRPLLTLLGPGGIGKTRLALALAYDALVSRAFDGGVYFAPLDAVQDAAAIPVALAAAVQAVPRPGEAPLDAAIRAIGRRRALLVVDNVEHVVEGAGRISELVSACPNLFVVATSRVRLELVEESVFRVEGLPVVELHGAIGDLGDLGDPGDPGDPDGPEDSMPDAVRLFLGRARQADLGFEPDSAELAAIRRLCSSVGGAPLAIELAAAGVRDARPTEIERQLQGAMASLESPLRNVPDRHRSLRASFERSWDRLGARDRLALARLSVFRGGFDAAAARMVAGATRFQLERLHDRSLLAIDVAGDRERNEARAEGVVRGPDLAPPAGHGPGERLRYDLHPVVRYFANERLAVDDVDRIRRGRLHTRWCRLLVQREARRYMGPAQMEAHARLARERGNIAAVLERTTASAEERDVEAALDLVGRLEEYWRFSGSFVDGRTWAERVLEQVDPEVGSAEAWSLAAHALATAAGMTLRTGDAAKAHDHAQRAVEVARRVPTGEPDGAIAASTLARSLLALGDIALAAERVAQALERFSAALVEAARTGDDRSRIAAHLGLGSAYLHRKRFDAAAENFRHALARSEARGAAAGIAAARFGLGEVARDQTDWLAAEPHFMASLERAAELGDRWGVARTLGELGGVPYQRREFDRAAQRYRESLDIYLALGDTAGVAKAHHQIGLSAKLAGRFDEALEHQIASLRLRMELGAGRVIESNLWAMATLATAMGDAELAARFWGAKAGVSQDREYVWADLAQKNFAEDITETREALDPDAFEAAFREGRETSVGELIGQSLSRLRPS